VAADGTYAWGSTSGSAYYAGAGLTANFGGDAGTVSVSGTVETRHGIRIEAAYTISSGTVSLAGANATANTVEVTTGNTGTVTAALSGSNGLTKSGEGTLVLQADNSALTGAVAVTNGTLQANATNALGGATSVTVSTGGSFLISEDNAVNNSASVTLAGGTLAMGGTTTDTVGMLTLTANSIIDLGTFSGNLIFANSSAINWTGGTMLSIWNWNGTNMYGTSYGAGDRHIFVGNSSAGLTQNQLNSISFYSDSGNSFIGTGFIDSTGEIGAVPEPEAIIRATVLLAGIGIYWLRRRRASQTGGQVWQEK
jgi:fibronectin-binding autotransporter adhesin